MPLGMKRTRKGSYIRGVAKFLGKEGCDVNVNVDLTTNNTLVAKTKEQLILFPAEYEAIFKMIVSLLV